MTTTSPVLPRLFVIGDSISIQYGPYLEQLMAGKLHYARKTGETEALLNLDIPQGVNGGDSAMVLDYLRGIQRTGGLPADVLLLNCGLHDIKTDPVTKRRQVEIDQYRQNLQEIVTLARQLVPALVWIRTTPCDEAMHNTPGRAFHRFAADQAAYNAAADAVMTAAAVPSIDLDAFTRPLGPDLYCDHVHFHEPIRKLQAAFIAGWVIGRFAS